MKCPRCQTEMQEIDFEGCRIDICPNCEGSWYDMDELAEIMELPLDTLESSSLSPILVGDKHDKVDLNAPLQCPRCGQNMNRFRYLGTSEVWLDECPTHGVFLDDGELTQMLDALQESQEIDPETAKFLEAELKRIKMESEVRNQSILKRLGAKRSKLGRKLIGVIYNLLKQLGTF